MINRETILPMKEKQENTKKKTVTFLGFIESMVSLIVWGILLFSILSFFVCLIVFTQWYADQFSVKELLMFIPFAVLSVGIYKLAKYLQQKKEAYMYIVMIGISVVFSVFMIITYNTQPSDGHDYIAIWEAATKMASDKFTDGLKPDAYMYYYSWQLGIAAFESVIIRIFGEHFIVLKILNAMIMILNNILIYNLVKRKSNKKIGCMAYVISTFYIPWILTIPQFTNHQIGLVFILISLRLLDNHNWYSWFFAGITIALLNILRPIGIILILTSVCACIYDLVKMKNCKILLNIIVLLIAYMSIINVFNYMFIKVGYTDIKISGARIPYFKLQKGLYGYENPYRDLESFDFDYDKYNEAMKNELTDRVLNNKLETIVFVTNKMCRYLGLFDYQFGGTYSDEVAYAYPVKGLYSMGWFQYIALVIWSCYGYYIYRKKYKVDVYMIYFIGSTLVYIFVEAFTSYRFESYEILIMLAAVGISYIASLNNIMIIPRKKLQ